MSRQFESWHSELAQAIQQQGWPHGEKQARASYEPLLELMSETCFRYRLFIGAAAPACERAKSDFSLSDPIVRWTPVPDPVPNAATIEPQENPTVVGAPERSVLQATPQTPPNE